MYIGKLYHYRYIVEIFVGEETKVLIVNYQSCES